MKVNKQYFSKLFYNKLFWQIILSLFMLCIAIFFVRHEHIELFKIKEQLLESDPLYVLLGIALTVLYILLQGKMYEHSFRALGQRISLKLCTQLFLKRNFISVFLPAGGFTSLAFFTKKIEKQGATKSQIHLASTLFGFIGILSVVLFAVPVLGIALLFYDLQQAEILGFIFLILLTIAFVVFIYSVSKKGKAYRWLSGIRPSLSVVLDEMIEQQIDRKQVWLVLIASLAIEVIGIVHLYIAMLALGFEPSWIAATIGYIAMVILLIASPLLRGLGAIEVSLTYILNQFGFPVLAAATIVLLYRFFEFWLPLFVGILSFLTKKDNLLLRLLPATIIFSLGIVNVISAVTPAITSRLRLIKDIIPEELISTSNGLVLVFGLLLVILSIFLVQGSKRAWIYAVVLTLFSAAGNLVKAGDYEEAIFALVSLCTLLYTRKSYQLKPHPKLTRVSYLVLLYSVLSLLIFGVIALYFINQRHFGIDFEFTAAIVAVLKLFFLFDTSTLIPQTPFAQNFLYAIYTAGGLVLTFIFFSVLNPFFTKPFNSPEDRILAQDIIEKYGKSALDYFKVYSDKLFFFSDDREGVISFKITRHFAVVLENPVCKDEVSFIALVKKFDRFCEQNGFISIYYRIPKQSLALYQNLGKKSLPIGEEAVIDLPTFTLEGSKIRPTRSAINRLTGEGYAFKVHHPPIKEGMLQKLNQVSDEWLEDLGQKEIAFTQGVFDRSILKNQIIITIEDQEERIYAFLNLIPDYAPGDVTYDLIRRVKDAPNGVLDMLMAKTLLYLKEEGHQSVNLGLAPLSGIEGENLTEKAVKYGYDNLKAFGHFKGLRNYKNKFFPRWEKRYLIYSHNYHLLQVPNALKRVSEGS